MFLSLLINLPKDPQIHSQKNLNKEIDYVVIIK